MVSAFYKKGLGFLLLISLFFTYSMPVYASPLTGADSDIGIYQMKNMMGTWVVDTTDANDADSIDDGSNGGSDVKWTLDGNPDTQTHYWGHLSSKFSKIVFNVGTAATPSENNIILYYYNGTGIYSGWELLTITSGAQALLSTGVQTIAFDAPADWTTTTVNSTTGYYIQSVNAAGLANAEISQISLYVGGGGQTAVPEFSTYIFMITLGLGALFIYSRSAQKGSQYSI